MFSNAARCLGADLVELLSRCRGIHGKNHISLQTVPVPAEAYAVDVVDAVDVVERVCDFVDEFRFDAVEEAASDASDRADEEDEDRGGDDQPALRTFGGGEARRVMVGG